MLFWMTRAARVLALLKSVTYGNGTMTTSPRRTSARGQPAGDGAQAGGPRDGRTARAGAAVRLLRPEITGVQVRIVNEAGEDVAPGEMGEIIIRGRARSKGTPRAGVGDEGRARTSLERAPILVNVPPENKAHGSLQRRSCRDPLPPGAESEYESHRRGHGSANAEVALPHSRTALARAAPGSL